MQCPKQFFINCDIASSWSFEIFYSVFSDGYFPWFLDWENHFTSVHKIHYHYSRQVFSPYFDILSTCECCALFRKLTGTFWLNSNPVHRQIDWQADSCCLLTASQKRRGFRFQILYDIRTIRYDEREPGIEPFWNLSIMAMGNFREFWKNIL